jgi:hypothetical protein
MAKGLNWSKTEVPKNFENLNGQGPNRWSKDQISQRNSETMGLAKSRFIQGLIKRLAKGRDQKNKALIPNETNKVRSHKNYPKYLEYNKVIHVGL